MTATELAQHLRNHGFATFVPNQTEVLVRLNSRPVTIFEVDQVLPAEVRPTTRLHRLSRSIRITLGH